MLVAVMVIFALCWMPILLFDIWQTTTQKALAPPWSHTTRMWLHLLSYVNSCVNAFIFYWASESVYFLYLSEIQNLKCYSYLVTVIVKKYIFIISVSSEEHLESSSSASGRRILETVSVTRNRKRKCEHTTSLSVISTNIYSNNVE